VPAMHALVKVLVSGGSFAEGKLVEDDGGGVGLAMVDEFYELAVIGLDLALAGADLLALKPEFAEVDSLNAGRERGHEADGADENALTVTADCSA